MASLFATLLALALALLLSLGLGAAAYAITQPKGLMTVLEHRGSARAGPGLSAEFIFFAIVAFLFLIWATLPLSTGSSRHFDPGALLMYPISLKKLFAFDFISEFTTLQSIFSVPALLALGIGAGLGKGMLTRAVIASVVAIFFGVVLTRWLSLSIGSLLRKRRTRGETIIAIIGASIGLGGALAGQVAPIIFKYADSVWVLRWTPPGAIAYALTTGLSDDVTGYVLAVFAVVSYTILLIVVSYWIARRNALGISGGRRKAKAAQLETAEVYTGWDLPLISTGVAAVVEKELRYVLRNAQLRMMALMPLILIVVRLMNRRTLRRTGFPGGTSFRSDFFAYADGLILTGGVLYVFLILSGLLCNQFAFEEGGMRALILSPIQRRKILIGKNIALTLVALIFSSVLLFINQLIFRDLKPGSLLFASLSFLTFASLMSVMGNWFSIRFPKRMKFGKRLNVSGVVGLMIIPMIIVLMLPPLAAVAAGYVAQSLAIEYVTLIVFAGLAFTFYVLMIDSQGESLQQREIAILEAVREPADD